MPEARLFAPILKRLLDSYPGKVRLVVRYAPFHEGSGDVVRILEAARLQGRYWETLNLLYLNQGAWTVQHRVHLDRGAAGRRGLGEGGAGSSQQQEVQGSVQVHQGLR